MKPYLPFPNKSRFIPLAFAGSLPGLLGFAPTTGNAQTADLPAEAPTTPTYEIGTAQTFELPVWGKQWKDGPVFKVNERPLWKLNCYGYNFLHHYSDNPVFSAIIPGGRAGALRYDANRQGFVRPAVFDPPTADLTNIKGTVLQPREKTTDTAKFPLLAWSENGRNLFGAAGNVSSTVSFVAPFAGTYVANIRADKARFKAPFDHLGLNLTCNRTIHQRNFSEKYIENTPTKNGPVQARVEVDLLPGEEITLVAQTNSDNPKGSACWENLTFKVSYYPPA